MSDANAVALVVTCVHGTWGRGIFPRMSGLRQGAKSENQRSAPRWFENESDFQHMLTRELVAEGVHAEFDQFVWSGDNSILQRDAAGEELARLLSGQVERFPGYERVIIAHSHGGNVAMRALHYLPDIGEPIRVITLATPFVRVLPSDADVFTLKEVEFFLSIVLFLLGPIAVVGAVTCALSVLENAIRGTLPFLQLISLATLGLTLLVLGLFGCNAWFDTKRLSQWLVGSSKDDLQFRAFAGRLCDAAAMPPSRSLARRLLVVRGVDDEAAFALASGAIAARLTRILIALLSRAFGALHSFGTWIFALVFILISWLGTSIGMGWISSWLATLVTCLVLAYFLAIPILAAPAVLICCAFKSVCGRELLHGSLFLDVLSHSTPDNAGNVDTLTLPFSGRGPAHLRHFLYAHPDVGLAIAIWLSATRAGSLSGQEYVDLLVDGCPLAQVQQGGAAPAGRAA